MNVIDALALARELHAGQVDKAGEPYIWHPVRVMMRLPANSNAITKIAALLHDAIEDCNVSERDLVARGVPRGAARMVFELSRPKGEIYADFIARIALLGGNVAKVKRADIEDNSDSERMEALAAIDPTRAEFLLTKYRDALRVLSAADVERQSGEYSLSQMAAAVAAERERCAQECERVKATHEIKAGEHRNSADNSFRIAEACGAEDCAEAIRSHK